MFPCRISRLILHSGKIDFRKQWNGLLQEARRLGFDPYAGEMVVFVKRDKTQLRAICGDEKGLYLFSRRFEGGSLKFLFSDSQTSITEAELALWFEGAQFSIHRHVKSWR
jgi:hypothetical protein